MCLYGNNGDARIEDRGLFWRWDCVEGCKPKEMKKQRMNEPEGYAISVTEFFQLSQNAVRDAWYACRGVITARAVGKRGCLHLA
jgi:hypothetical protein